MVYDRIEFSHPHHGVEEMSARYIRSLGLLAFTLGLVSLIAQPANAIKQFRDEFKAKYVKADSQEPKDVALREAVEQAGCSVCHVGEERTNRNSYGQALAKLLDRKTDAKNKQKIQAALEKAAAMKTNPGDPKSPTFGELLSQGKLPAAK
jgi:hypothetical protein